ncbi:MAG: fold metallo-hydrolase [Glaciihabitans sp.]|nr:fold metallo-hydrolase [Glaciihabitans sp.]
MRVTKYEHAAFVVEDGEDRLIVDPGSFTSPLGDIAGVVAVVITHEHQDHWTPEQLTRILDRNPGAKLYGPAGVVKAAASFAFTEVNGGDVVDVGPFTLKFFGEKHAVIHSSIPVVDNVGVLINDTVYYPGDSFTVPTVPVDTLAVPASAPWMKTGEMMDFLIAVKPKRSFPAHELINSVIGNQMAYGRIKQLTEAGGGTFFPLEPTESIDL